MIYLFILESNGFLKKKIEQVGKRKVRYGREMWKLLLFDFDDTLYLKSTYEFVPHLRDTLCRFRMLHIPIGILTYNAKAISILKNAGLHVSFDFVVAITSKSELKSDVIQRMMIYQDIPCKHEILFFDNDPFNIYDVQRLGITCFLVHPVNGISRDIIDCVLQHDYERYHATLLQKILRSFNYIERTTLSQNLQQLDRLLRSSTLKA